MTHYAVRDERSGALYPQPNKLIAEKVTEMHGNCVVVPLPEEPVERLALAYLNLLRARVFGDPPRESVDEAKAADQIRADAVILLQAVYGAESLGAQVFSLAMQQRNEADRLANELAKVSEADVLYANAELLRSASVLIRSLIEETNA